MCIRHHTIPTINSTARTSSSLCPRTSVRQVWKSSANPIAASSVSPRSPYVSQPSATAFFHVRSKYWKTGSVNSVQSASTCASLRTHELAEVAARLSSLKGGATTPTSARPEPLHRLAAQTVDSARTSAEAAAVETRRRVWTNEGDARQETEVEMRTGARHGTCGRTVAGRCAALGRIANAAATTFRPGAG